MSTDRNFTQNPRLHEPTDTALLVQTLKNMGASCKTCANFKPIAAYGKCIVTENRVAAYNICHLHGKEIIRSNT